ncbi:MAG: inositol-3-phosphate synthase [Planctomycetes bacterium]|nr:inositol-3-phosphate synthase [Planctomycetota bacterium]
MTASRSTSPPRRIGVFIIGARGAVASCVATGITALRHRRIDTTGLVTARSLFDRVPLVSPASFVLGGAEVRRGNLFDAAMRMAAEGVIPAGIVQSERAELSAIDRRIVPGILDAPDGDPAGELYERESLKLRSSSALEVVAVIRQKLLEFKKMARVSDVVVVNLASTEAARTGGVGWATLQQFERALESKSKNTKIPASTLYAYAAIGCGFAYINFTPSLGARPPALEEFAKKNGVPHAGCDGKTGETLMKTVLAPLFRDRNLKVLGWEGYNMLGNSDGRTLVDPAHKAAKIANKDRALRQLLGERPDLHTRVSIDYVPSLGDWKTAWDFIHFAGFFGTRMTLQFTWGGSDSALAAPLVIDLIRLAELSHRRGESGAMKHAAPFFKSPLGVPEHDFHKQNQMLQEYAKSVSL